MHETGDEDHQRRGADLNINIRTPNKEHRLKKNKIKKQPIFIRLTLWAARPLLGDACVSQRFRQRVCTGQLDLFTFGLEKSTFSLIVLHS